MPATRQLRLLLWKDYLTRKRKLITLGGIVWATAVMMSLYIVRINVDSLDYHTCQFPARALPTAGMLPFLQSFLCSVNNECEALDRYDPIPSYEGSKLSQIQKQFSPILNNETVLDVAATVPDALKLLSKLADVFDDTTFVDISKRGLKVEDLFTSPKRVKRYISKRLELNSDVTESLMTSQLSLQGFFKGSTGRCNVESMSDTVLMDNKQHLNIVVERFCSLTDDEVNNILRDLMTYIDFNKFIRMAGNMYYKLSNDTRLTKLADTVTAVVRMTTLQHFLPPELVSIIQRDETDFSYFPLDMIQKFVSLFEPVFGDTEGFQSIKQLSDTMVTGLRYLNSWILQDKVNNTIETNGTDVVNTIDNNGTDLINLARNTTSRSSSMLMENVPIDIFDVLSHVTSLINKMLPDEIKHDVLLYATLLAKLIEGANKVIEVNMNIEERTYDVSLRHPEGIKILVNLPSAVVAKGFEAMTDAERTQVMTAKMSSPGQMFCDLNRLQNFFKVGKDEASSLRNQLCTDAWKSYMTDLIKSFGIFEVKDNINAMASLLIQETLGRDVSDQLYTIDHDFQILKNFANSLAKIKVESRKVDWLKLLNVTEDSQFMRTVRDRGHLGKQMLIIVHGCLAKEVVKQNPILSYKISPGLIDTTTLVKALNDQLDSTEQDLVEKLKKMYPAILETVVLTALSEGKTYKSLSTHSEEIMCNGVENAVSYIELPNSNQEQLVTTLCSISRAIERGLTKDSVFGKAITKIRTSKHTSLEEVKWTTLISGLKSLYVKLDKDYPYLFEYNSYGLNEDTRDKIENMVEQAKSFWFGEGNIGRSVHLGLKFGFRLFELVDRDIFNVSSAGWGRFKYTLYATNPPLSILHDFISTIAAIHRNESYSSNLPPSTARAIELIMPNIPLLISDAVQIILRDDIELSPIISLLNTQPPWPCSTTSLSTLLPLSPASSDAVEGLETIWCMDQNFTGEWIVYLEDRNVTKFDLKKWNTTTYPPHVFLQFSSAVDGAIEDGEALRAMVEDIVNASDGPWTRAWKTIEEMFRRNDRDVLLTSFFSKLDSCLTSTETMQSNSPIWSLWTEYLSCKYDCQNLSRLAWKGSLQFISVMTDNIAGDLLEYFTEVHDPNSNVLQVMGFTKSTILYDLYEKLPDFMGVLLHSYWDFGFMSQIRRAALTNFWDCDALVEAMVPPPYSRINEQNILKIKPYICPSFLYWLSLPRGDNKLLDVVSKPQYYFYTLPSENLTSSYKDAYTTIIKLTNFLTEAAKENQTRITENDIKMNSIQYKFEKLVDSVINYSINETDPSYKNFFGINKMYFSASLYLTKIVSIVNEIALTINSLKIDDFNTSIEDTKKLEGDLNSIQQLFKRRPVDMIQLHFDLITDIALNTDEDYSILQALETSCYNHKNNDTTRVILLENKRTKNQICAMKYIDIYKFVQKDTKDEFNSVRASLLSFVKVLQNGNDDEIKDVYGFIKERKPLIKSLQKSTKYSYDLSLPIYLQYLQSNLRHYDVIANFLLGRDWWGELRTVYSGSQASAFFDAAENTLEIVEDIFSGLDRIHLVRLLHDINVNNSEAFCSPSITLSDYIPDNSARLSELKRSLCEEDRSSLFIQLPPLLFASQGYDSDLKLSPSINYTTLNQDIARTESNVRALGPGPKTPLRPPWVTEERLQHLREVAVNLLAKESLTKISFGLISNLVDASTLFLNSSKCTMCSEFTSWVKQLNLQIFKKQEYNNLLCRMKDMTLLEVHRALQTDFHWDMAIGELIQTRNYTKYELNKSLNEFLELVKQQVSEDVSTGSPRLADCLASDVSTNALGNATLVTNIISHVARLLRSEVPHLHKIAEFTSLPYFKKLSTKISPRLDVYVPLKKYLKPGAEGDLEKMLEGILDADVNLRLANQNLPANMYVKLAKSSWEDVYMKYNCSDISKVIGESINTTLVEKDLPKLQDEEFWRFSFISRILLHIEGLLRHSSNLLGVLSRADLQQLAEGKLAALLDLALQLLGDDVTQRVVDSIDGLVEELSPLLDNTSLRHDLLALSSGLHILQQFKRYLLGLDLKLPISIMWDSEGVERGLARLGINNTNFWSLAAPRLQAGHIDLAPLLTSTEHIAYFACDMSGVSRVLLPGALDVVSGEDVAAAVVDQWCALGDVTQRHALRVLMQHLNYSAVMEKMADIILPQLYSSANLTTEEGSLVMERYPQMAALLPVIQDSVGDLGQTIADEPLVQSLKSGTSVGGLLGSPEFLSNAGRMLCGKPFQVDQNRFIKAIAESEDFSNEPVQEQLDALPTDFCRSLYKDILSMNGGKIVWSFVKPLIMGRILYTPSNPTVDTIIRQANITFNHMTKLVNMVHSFSSAFPSLSSLSEHREGVVALRRILYSPSFSQLRAMIVGDTDIPDVDVAMFDDFENFKSLGSVLKRGSDLLHCVNLDRFHAAPDEDQLTHRAALLSQLNEFSAGLVFLNSEKSDYMKNVEYKIRMDIDNVPTTARLKNYLWIPGPESSFLEHMRYFRGFIQIQDLVNRAIVQLSRSNTTRQKRETETENEWAVYTQQEPYPCYRKDFFQTSLYESQALMVGLFFCLLFSVASCVRFIVEDKETGNTHLMSAMGVSPRSQTFSWWSWSLLELCAAAGGAGVVLCAGGILPRTDVTLVFALLLLFAVSVLSFCYMISKLFTSASLAAVCAPIIYLMTFMPFVLILSLEAVLGVGLKLCVCLSMSTSICYAFLSVTRGEARGEGTGWAQLWDHSDDDLSIGVAATMTVLDSLLYVAVGLLIDRFFGPKTLQSSITHSNSEDEKAGVSIVNVTKIYNEGSRRQKTALENVSIELFKGQVTTLLGHNGAGKTTLINILTGMVKPTKGGVVIRSGRGGTRVGVCPQRDVLFECLTAAEHVALYAQLKSNLTRDKVQGEIDEMLQVLSLGEAADTVAGRLSGGTRRRLCVALAFVGRPQLVSLDEPTAGVDPKHRRDIWSMIVKLRADRTVLLTTHHLDEAELLSDQIVIMHKGQVHTSGSPIDIKRTLGDGYKLSVIYPKLSDPWPEETPSMNERTKELLTEVKKSIKNASLNDVSGLEVEVGLPFFDADGLNNNFLELCSSLESKQAELGFRDYSLDCASLEQVFFNVTQDHPPGSNNASNHIQCEVDGNGGLPNSESTSSVRSKNSPLVSADGPLRARPLRQCLALLHARYLHYSNNTWLLFLLFVLPSVFVAIAMGFSLVRPPPDNEVPLKLNMDLYEPSTQYLVSNPTVYSEIDPSFAERILQNLMLNENSRNWNPNDTPNCTCSVQSKHVCSSPRQRRRPVLRPAMMVLPDVDTLNRWIVDTHDGYIERRYGGYSAVLKNNKSYLVAWYNNKGHHSMPTVVNEVYSAALRAVSGDRSANITVRSHPLKISQEQLSKDTVYQHVADAGISALVLLAYCLVSAGGAATVVAARRSQQKRLQLLCGVTPASYWLTALLADLLVIVINIVITVIVFEAFGFPVFVARNNLPAICLLILLYGYACGSLTHLLEKLFDESSLANMVLFCGYSFLGLGAITILLILDIISDSEETDNARWVLHKIFLVCPQFVLGDGMLEIAKNTIQAQVLNRFGMDTYKEPVQSGLLRLHYLSLAAVGTALLALNLAVEYDYFAGILGWLRRETIEEKKSGEMEDWDVAAERKRVMAEVRGDNRPLRLPTLGNINAGFVDTEVLNNCTYIKRHVSCSHEHDAAQCVRLGKVFPALGLAGGRVAVRDLTLGIPASQCTALLGENGAGKSTTFAMLTGEQRPTAGHIYLTGTPASPTQLCRGLISYCPQTDAIDYLMTVEETLLFYCRLRGIEEHQEVIRRTLEMFDLSKYAEVRNGQLSGGNKRKLCAAIAFMGRTPLVLLDEPTSGMDPGSRRRVARGVRAACGGGGGGGGRAVLLSTHALDDARRLAARVALMRAGELCALAPLDDCLRRFGGGYVVSCRWRGSGAGAGAGAGVGAGVGGDRGGGGEGARAVWRRVQSTVPQAQLTVLHQTALHFLLPITATVDKKEVSLALSDIFAIMARLQATCHIDDYTVNQSSLDQMFLSFTDKGESLLEPTDLEPLPTIPSQHTDHLDSVTSL